jgi:threonine dehydrogenase-like Zn-dependent dehydrogenase
MKALAKLERAPGLTLTRVKKPEVGHNDVMIRIAKTAICGTDIHIWKWDEWAQKTIPVPMHVGHEYVGEIVELGQEVRGFALGDRVSGEGHITCGFCRNCRAGRRHLCRNTVGVGVNREGAFADYLVIPAFNAFKIPDDISDDLAAIFDPFGNATHTALAFNLVGSRDMTSFLPASDPDSAPMPASNRVLSVDTKFQFRGVRLESEYAYSFTDFNLRKAPEHFQGDWGGRFRHRDD